MFWVLYIGGLVLGCSGFFVCKVYCVYADVAFGKGGGRAVTIGIYAVRRCLCVWVCLAASLGVCGNLFWVLVVAISGVVVGVLCAACRCAECGVGRRGRVAAWWEGKGGLEETWVVSRW